MRHLKTLVAFVLGSVFFAGVAYAAPWYTFQKSILPSDATENLGTTTSRWDEGHFNELCLTADCRTSWPTGGGGGSGNVATSTGETQGFLSYWTTTNGTPATLGQVATTSLTATSPLSLSQAISVIGAAASALSIDTSGAWTGNAGTASALFANGTNASAGNAILGVDASGNAEGAFDVWTEAENTAAAYTPQARTVTIAGTANQVTSSAGAQDLSANRTWTLSLPSHVIFPGNFQATNATTTNATTSAQDILSLLTFGGVTGNSWDDFCVSVTGSADLCDGSDASGAGGSSAFEIATTSTIAAPHIAYFTQASGRTTLGSVATSSLTIGAPLTTSGTPGALVGGTNLTIDIDDIKAADLDLTDITLADFTNDPGYFDNIADFTGTLTDTRFCTYDQAGGEIDCDTVGGSGITELGSGFATTTGTSITFSTSTQSFNGLTVGGTITRPNVGALLFTPLITGTLDNAGLTNSSVSYGGVTLSLGGTDATPAFNLADATGLPISTGVSGLGSNVATALGVNVGTAGAFVVNGGALGTPSSGTLTNATGLPIVAGTTGTLTVARGGTGSTTAPSGQVLYGGGDGIYQSVATSTLTGNSQIAVSQTAYVLGPTAPVLSVVGDSIGDTQLAFNTGQNLTTASSPSFTGLTVGTLNGLIKGTTGVLSAATAGTDYVAGGTGANTQVSYFTAAGTIAGDAGMTYGASTDLLTVVNASTTAFSTAYASSTVWRGGGLTGDCDDPSTAKVLWDTTTGQFSCGTDQGGAGGSPGGSTGQLQFNNAGAFGGLADSAWNTAGFLGIGSTTPWGLLSIASSTWADYSRPLFSISTSTGVFGQLFNIFATTTTLSTTADNSANGYNNGARAGLGTNSSYGFPGLLDNLTVAGRINSVDWNHISCDSVGAEATADATGWCGQLNFREDGTGTLTSLLNSADAIAQPYGNIVHTGVNDGAGIWLPGDNNTASAGWVRLASSTPVMEVTMRMEGVQYATTTSFYFGFHSINGASTAMETPPTAGCYFTASSTQANWWAVCRTSAANITMVNTNVASSSDLTGDNGNFRRFRVEADGTHANFYIQERQSSGMVKVADISTNYPATTPLYGGLYFADTSGGSLGAEISFYRFRFWWRDFLSGG